jgi:threonylcarbamoyladenosine tRNA methylthiotransferase MtaB
MRIYLTALGCRLNQAEIETLGREAARRGHTVVGSPAEADWAIINTCTVTHIAARKSRQAVRRLGRAHPGLRVAVIGCYGETSPREASRLPGVALVAPNLDKEQVLDRIGAVTAEGDPPAQAPAMAEGAALAHLPCERTRAFIRVQDGCENACAYCLVTIARGPARSTPPHEVLAMAQQRRGEGVNEIVLSGVNIGSYGRDSGAAAGWTLAQLAQAVLAGCDAPRLRFSSIEPWDVSPELLMLWDNPRVCRQLHLPLQSGCDDTLRRMARRMSAAAFAALVSQARAAIPGLAVTTDVMVGFPGETEREFEASMRFVEQMAFARLHVFRYSPRPGTPAYALPDQVAPDVALARSQAMAALGHHLAWRFHADLVGRQVEVLFESATVAGGRTFWSGWTDTYVRVRACAEADLANSLRPVMVMAAATDSVSGELA